VAVLAVVSVVGKDQKGVVAQFATFMADRGINIEDIEQRVVRGHFIMDMLVDLADLTGDLSALITGLLDLGKKLEMDVRVNLHPGVPARTKRIAVLVSREPNCLRQLLEDSHYGRLNGQIVAILGNHPDLEPLAREAKIPFDWQPADDAEAHFRWLGKKLEELGGSAGGQQVDLLVLARYMRILPPELVRRFTDCIINIHPSLLPYFPGAAPYKQAYESGVRVHGCTAHFVTEQLDEGPVILQDVFHINVGVDSLEEVKAKGLDLEASVLSRSVQLFLNEELLVVDGKVIFKPGISRFLQHAQPTAAASPSGGD
jgi:formyltetrahydrofolate deformylase